MSHRDNLYMQRAINLANRGLFTTDPNPRVGCVLVNGDDIVGEGWHERSGGPHAEINALQQAGIRAKGATAYITLEPCCHTGKTPPCTDALIGAGVVKVIAAMEDPNPLVAGNGFSILKTSGIATECGLLKEEARKLNPGFIKRMEIGLPYVRIKMAMSLDGRTAMSSGESQWITGEAARADVQRLRARSSAILTGIDTVLHDDPSLNVRLDTKAPGIDGKVRQPMRVVLDSRLRFPPNAQLCNLDDDAEIMLITTSESRPELPKVQIEQVPANEGHTDLSAAMGLLASKGINEVHVEAGPTLTGAMLSQQLVDEIVIYIAPHLMGNTARSLFHLPGLTEMKDRIRIEILDIRSVGKDIRITCCPVYSSN